MYEGRKPQLELERVIETCELRHAFKSFGAKMGRASARRGNLNLRLVLAEAASRSHDAGGSGCSTDWPISSPRPQPNIASVAAFAITMKPPASTERIP